MDARLGGTARLFIISFSIVFLHFAYRDGDELAKGLDRPLRGTIGDSAAPYLELVVRAVRATVVSMVAVALFSGTLTGIIYAIAGVKDAVASGAVTGLFAMIPYLGDVLVAGVACSLAGAGAATSGLAVFVLGGIAHFARDKIVRPVLVGSAVRLGFPWVLMGTLGGLQLMGLLGLPPGPVVLSLGSSSWRQWGHNRAP